MKTLTVMVQLAKNCAIAFSKFLKSLLSISNIADLRQWMESSNVNKVIRAVLNSLFFLRKDFAHTKSTKRTKRTKTSRQKHKNANK